MPYLHGLIIKKEKKKSIIVKSLYKAAVDQAVLEGVRNYERDTSEIMNFPTIRKIEDKKVSVNKTEGDNSYSFTVPDEILGDPDEDYERVSDAILGSLPGECDYDLLDL